MDRLSTWKLRFRRMAKTCVGILVLNPVYRLCCLMPIRKNLVVLADGHQNTMPSSMKILSQKLRKDTSVEVAEYFHDYSFSGAVRGLQIMLKFLPLYARAEYVFICDAFLPVSYCKRRSGTTVVQLWHSCGLMKKVGKDSEQERKLMSHWQYKNYDVFTTSSPVVSRILSGAMDIPESVFSQAGVSRMDTYFDIETVEKTRYAFFEKYPQYRGKKLILWAPTFRGTAQTGTLAGQEEILRLQAEMPDDYKLIIRTHRFVQGRNMDTHVEFSSEELLMVADMLITDYSSIYFDYLYFRRPIVLFAPDLENYLRDTGMYVSYEKFPGLIAKTYDALYDAVLTAGQWADRQYRERMDAFWNEQMVYCDGSSTEKLLRQIGLIR